MLLFTVPHLFLSCCSISVLQILNRVNQDLPWILPPPAYHIFELTSLKTNSIGSAICWFGGTNSSFYWRADETHRSKDWDTLLGNAVCTPSGAGGGQPYEGTRIKDGGSWSMIDEINLWNNRLGEQLIQDVRLEVGRRRNLRKKKYSWEMTIEANKKIVIRKGIKRKQLSRKA